jgi:hypothetical protein
METVSTVFHTRSHKAVETAWSRIASTHHEMKVKGSVLEK